MNTIMPGDVFIKGGSPGQLATGYIRAQDIHVEINTGEPGLSPWYATDYASIVNFPNTGLP